MATHLLPALTEKDYEKFAKNLLEFSSTRRLIEYLTTLFDRYKDENPKFWPYLFVGFQKVRTAKFIHEDQEESIRSRIDREAELKSVKEKEVYVNKLLSDKVEEFLKAKRSEKYKLKQLPIIEKRFSKLDSLPDLKRKFYRPEILRLTRSLLRIAFEGDFTVEDICDLKMSSKASKEVLKILLKYYFTIEDTNNGDDLVLKSRNEKGQFIYYNKIIPTKKSKNSINLFHRAYIYHSARKIDGNSLFKGFQNFERNRFQAIAKYFDETDVEYALISNYLYRIGRLTEKTMEQHLGKTYSFGIDRQLYFETLKEILDRLTDEVAFIYFDGKNEAERKRIINDAASVLTTNDYTKEDTKIKFRCETTTVAYIVNALNNKFSSGLKFNAYSIGKSKLFFIPRFKIPSNHEFIGDSDFHLLNTANFNRSIGRFFKYSKNNGKIEHHHFRELRPIFSKYHL